MDFSVYIYVLKVEGKFIIWIENLFLVKFLRFFNMNKK